MPEENLPVQKLPEEEQSKDKSVKEKKESPITIRWVLFGMAAIVLMWLLSSLLFK